MDNFHKLIEGFHNFKQTYFLKERQYFESLEKAQNPKTLVGRLLRFESRSGNSFALQAR